MQKKQQIYQLRNEKINVLVFVQYRLNKVCKERDSMKWEQTSDKKLDIKKA